MRLYGYPERLDDDEEDAKIITLGEATIVADVATLRKLVVFVNHVITEMEKHGDRFNHSHFSDFDRSVPDLPQLVIARPATDAERGQA